MNRSTELAIQRTKLANQRTYLAYMRTGIVISGAAAAFDQVWLTGFGIFMLVISGIQFFVINNDLNKNMNTNRFWLEYTPMLYIVFCSLALIAQLRNNRRKGYYFKKMMNKYKI